MLKLNIMLLKYDLFFTLSIFKHRILHNPEEGETLKSQHENGIRYVILLKYPLTKAT